MDEIRKLEQGIAALEAQRQELGDEVVDASLAPLKAKLAELQATSHGEQRKLATILFMDLVGHTEITRNLDPEDQMAVVDPAIARMAKKVSDYGGHIARFQGDGFKAVFGLPVAREKDAQQAIRSGLSILEEAGAISEELKTQHEITGFNVRVGISTGLVFAGGETEGEDTIKGNPVNLAARLENAAPPGGLLISHHTYHHVRGRFDVETQEAVIVKGFPEPVAVYLVKREKPRAFHMGTWAVEGLETMMIGRDVELQALQNAYDNANTQSQTTVVTVTGEAGVGKSRLVEEFTNWLELRPESIWYFKGRAGQQTEGTPQYLLRDMLAFRFQILDSDPLAIVREKFESGVNNFLSEDSEMKAHFLGTWLGYDFSDSPHLQPARDDPEQIKNRATLYLAQFFTAITDQDPAVVLLDDFHRADSGSLDSVIDLARRQPDLPLLVVCIARPSLFERRPEWGEKLPAHTQLDLKPLTTEDSRALVAEILRLIDPMPQVLLDLVSTRSEGNPFYAEELIKMLIDDGVILTAPETWLIVPDQLVKMKVPATLTGVLQARLDKLQPQVKKTAQKAAVIGRIFWDQALAALEVEGLESLPALRTREFIFLRAESAFAGTVEYIFKHAILRDVIYETVLKRLRQQYHALVADWLVATAKENGRTEEYAALIGEHFQRANNMEEAAYWFGLAGKQAAKTYSYTEALRYLNFAIENTPIDSTKARFELLEIREKLHHNKGNRDSQLEDLEQMTNLAGELTSVEQTRVALRQAHYSYRIGEFDSAIKHARVAIEFLKDDGDTGLVSEGYYRWGMALYYQGKYVPAQELFQEGLELASAVGDKEWVVNCLNGLGIAAQGQRDSVSINEYFEKVQSISREIGNREMEAGALNNLGFIAWGHGDVISAKQYYEQSLGIFREIGHRFAEGITLINLGHVAFYRKDFYKAKDYYETALRIQREIGDQLGEGISLNELGAAALAEEELDLAESYYQRAFNIRNELKLTHYLAEDWAGLAKLKLAQGDLDSARRYGQQLYEYLKENPHFEGAENAMRAFRFTWETLTGLGETTLADDVLTLAAQVIQGYLDNNRDPQLQEIYLNQLHHAVLWAAWEKSGGRRQV